MLQVDVVSGHATLAPREETPMGMTMGMCSANGTLAALVDNGDAEDAEDYRLTCDECAALVDISYYEDSDGLCSSCYDACHFDCDGCGDEFHIDERSEEFPKLCVDCGCTKHHDEVELIWSQIEDVVGAWDGEDNEISRLKKLLAYARRLK
jgi:hypothetical protein